MDKLHIINKLSGDVRRLGAIGTISYVGALLSFVAALFVDFSLTSKGWALIVAGVALLLLSGVIYLKEALAKSANKKEALGVLREVFNRLAEQSTNGTKEQTVSITMTIDNLPKKILEVLEKL
jgi:hypothetical protein